MHYLYPVFKFFDSSWVGETVRGSKYLFPIFEAIHLLGLTILLGIMVIVSMRLFGLILTYMPTKELARNLAPYTTWSIITMLVTGFLLFASEALKCFDSPSFRFKMVSLILALIFQLTIYRKATTSDKADSSPGFARFTAVLAIVLWFGVGLGGRAIGFL